MLMINTTSSITSEEVTYCAEITILSQICVIYWLFRELCEQIKKSHWQVDWVYNDRIMIDRQLDVNVGSTT